MTCCGPGSETTSSVSGSCAVDLCRVQSTAMTSKPRRLAAAAKPAWPAKISTTRDLAGVRPTCVGGTTPRLGSSQPGVCGLAVLLEAAVEGGEGGNSGLGASRGDWAPLAAAVSGGEGGIPGLGAFREGFA